MEATKTTNNQASQMGSTESTEELFAARLKRVDDAIALVEPDRVPLVPWTSCLPFELYPEIGANFKSTLYDYEKAAEALVRWHLEFQPDAESSNAVFLPGAAGDLLKPTMMDWPGRKGTNLPDDSIYQMFEIEYMHEDEYSELLADKTGFFFNKLLPRMYQGLEGLKDFKVSPMSAIFTIPLAPLAKPTVQDALRNLLDFAEEQEKADGAFMSYMTKIMELGFPPFATAIAGVPFDILSDYLRGTTGALFDQIERPDEVKALCNSLLDLVKTDLAPLENSPSPIKRVFFPLHKGMDGFMNDDDYRTLYWQPFQELLGFLIDKSITPLILTEGPYETRYRFIAEQLRSFPPGSCIVSFEGQNYQEYKQAFKDVACLYGGIQWQILARGTVRQVEDHVKQLIDDAAEGGGLIIGVSSPMDNVPRANCEALFQTARSYGTY